MHAFGRKLLTVWLAIALACSSRSSSRAEDPPGAVVTLIGRVTQVYRNEQPVSTNFVDQLFAIEVVVTQEAANAGPRNGARIFIKTWQARQRPGEWKGSRGQKVIPARGDLVEFKLTEQGGTYEALAPDGIRIVMPASVKSASTGLELTLIQPGEFQMGSPEAESYRRNDEGLHLVRMTTPYYLGTYEVTQFEYRQVMQLRPSAFALSGASRDKVHRLVTERFPVDSVSWFDALEFCNRLSRKDGFEPYYDLTDIEKTDDSISSAVVTVKGGAGYRLPTEAEWEYACRAGTNTPYHYGKESSLATANVKSPMVAGGYGARNPKWKEFSRTTKVGSFPPNAWGLFDMHGNVEEWCADWYDKEDYARSPAEDPRGPPDGLHKVARGGSWLIEDAYCRAACRAFHLPREAKFYGGFRVARTPQP